MAADNGAYVEFMEIACDEYCKWVEELGEDELEEKCENCMIAKRLEACNL